jgi:hypothetical protein
MYNGDCGEAEVYWYGIRIYSGRTTAQVFTLKFCLLQWGHRRRSEDEKDPNTDLEAQ